MPVPKAQTAYNQAVATAKQAKAMARNVLGNIESLNATYPLLDVDDGLVAELDQIKRAVEAAVATLDTARRRSGELAERHLKANAERIRPGYRWSIR